MKTLESVLSQNKNLLGSNYCNLGKCRGVGPFGEKIFLSYRGANGWNIVRLNVWQLFFRNILGWYKETHLETVIEGWNRYKVGRIQFNPKKYKNLPDLEKKLEALWQKSRVSLPFPTFALFFGNCDLKNAQIFCFGEKHGDKAFRKYYNMIINKYYRPGDIVLVEGVPAGKVIFPDQFILTKYLRRGVKIQGWEPKNLEQPSFVKKNKMIADLNAKKNAFLANVLAKWRKKKKFSEKEIAWLEQKTRDFFQIELTPFYDFFFPLPEQRKDERLRSESIYQSFFTLLRKGEKMDQPILIMTTLVSRLVEKLESQKEKVAYSHLTKEENKKITEQIALRNESLSQEIEKYARSKKRVFLLGGAYHFFKNPKGDSEKVVEAIKRRNFIAATTSSVYTQFDLARHNSDLISLKKAPNEVLK